MLCTNVVGPEEFTGRGKKLSPNEGDKEELDPGSLGLVGRIDGLFGEDYEVFVLVADCVVERGATAAGVGVDGARGNAAGAVSGRGGCRGWRGNWARFG